MKRPIDIEKLLRWAFLDELPKLQEVQECFVAPNGFAHPWDGVARIGETGGAVVDEARNRYGLVPDFSAEALPHPDAVLVGDAVLALAELELELPDDWYPLADLGDLGTDGAQAVAATLPRFCAIDAAGRRWLKRAPSQLVMKHAILGGTPDWQAERPERKTVTGANGKPKWFRRHTVFVESDRGEEFGHWREVEIEGWDAKRRRPHPDGYQKSFLEPDPAEAIIGRAEYEVWHAALALLVAELDGLLGRWAPTGPARPVRPWETGEMPKARILRPVARQQDQFV